MIEFMLQIRMGEIDNKLSVRKHFSFLSDGNYIVSIKPANKRSLNQNKYAHAVLFPEVMKALREAGYEAIRTPEDAKQVCKALFLKKQILKNDDTGECVELIKDTSELTKLEMMEFINDVVRWAANQLNYVIPLPNEQTEMNF